MRVVIAEDLFLLRDGLVRLVEAYGHTVVAAVDNGPAVQKALTDHRPDVAIVDVRLPPTFSDKGLQAAISARKQVPGLPVLILSTHVEQLYARELLADERGGIGYLLKDRVMAEGLSNTAVAARLFLSEGAISKYTTTIFAKLGLTDDEDTNRRVRAVLTYLSSTTDLSSTTEEG